MKIVTFFKRPRYSLAKGLCKCPLISDKAAIKIFYRYRFKKNINLKNPQTFNEKLNWIKLYYRKDIFTTMVDKYEVKKLVTSKIGEEYVIPTLGVFDKWKDIDFNKIKPPFVIKPTHSSGTIAIIRSYKDSNLKKIEKEMKKALKRKYYLASREWPYKNVKPRLIIEKYMSIEKEKNLPVYKFFCFNGEPYLVQTIKNDKTSYETIDYFDMDWNRLDLRQNFPNSKTPLSKPVNFEKMKELAKTLSQGLPFIRVDLFLVNEQIYFSEYTFFSDAGFAKFHPEKWDRILGDKIILDIDGKVN